MKFLKKKWLFSLIMAIAMGVAYCTSDPNMLFAGCGLCGCVELQDMCDVKEVDCDDNTPGLETCNNFITEQCNIEDVPETKEGSNKITDDITLVAGASFFDFSTNDENAELTIVTNENGTATNATTLFFPGDKDYMQYFANKAKNPQAKFAVIVEDCDGKPRLIEDAKLSFAFTTGKKAAGDNTLKGWTVTVTGTGCVAPVYCGAIL